PIFDEKNLKVKNLLEKDLPYVAADENRLQQIFLNLIGNAIKFTDSGKIEISSELSHRMIFVSVRDSGIGIPSSQLGEIFSEFYQVDGSATRNYEGSGLGLSVAKKLVELHGGTIEAHSDETGSVFTFSLPLSEELFDLSVDAVSEKELKRSGMNTLPQDTFHIGSFSGHAVKTPNGLEMHSETSPTILAVDDDNINLHVVENQLSLHHFKVIKAASGMKALEFLEGGLNPDLILMDIMMPGISGLEATREIRKDHSLSDLPIIMLTAKNLLDDAIHGFEAGANDYITKPFDRRELLTRINTLIALKEKVGESIQFHTLKKELQIAHEIHRSILPSVLPDLEKYKIAVRYAPKESLGGDFYDFHFSKDQKQLSVLISDVSGHGYPAALVAAMVKVMYHSRSGEYFNCPGKMMSYMNYMLLDVQKKSFTTAANLFCDLETGRFEYANAGHTPLYIYSRTDKKIRTFFAKGTILGGFEESRYEQISSEIFPGDRIVLFTDGLSESVNFSDPDRMFGYYRFDELISEREDLFGEEYMDYFFSKFCSWIGRENQFYDDVTIVVIDIL
ncbi:MAG: SpoIIE family protein phosphatase, partial [Spirochaetia bacterium]|nr:SpoIIE family protein phosphatase [Spirochaetia bacterium]